MCFPPVARRHTFPITESTSERVGIFKTQQVGRFVQLQCRVAQVVPRHQMARYYLSNSALELNEAAYLLGFEDPNSFGRAFRNWEGMPPSDWRETHRSTKAMRSVT